MHLTICLALRNTPNAFSDVMESIFGMSLSLSMKITTLSSYATELVDVTNIIFRHNSFLRVSTN